MICLAQCYLFAVDIVGLIWVRAKRVPVNEKNQAIRNQSTSHVCHLPSLWYPCGAPNFLWFESVELECFIFNQFFIRNEKKCYLDVVVADRNHSIAFFAFDFRWCHSVRWFVSSAAVVVRLHVRFHFRMDCVSLCRWFVGAHETISIDLVWCVNHYVRMMRNYTTDFSKMSAKKKNQMNKKWTSWFVRTKSASQVMWIYDIG